MSSYYQHEDTWTWDLEDVSRHTMVNQRDKRTVTFHARWSKGTAGIRGTRRLNRGRYYWELETTRRTIGTSVMFGIAKKEARTCHHSYVDLMGNDTNSWAMSHRGYICHDNVAYSYTENFANASRNLRIGVEFDGIAGTLAFYRNGEYLGVAFRGLQHVKEPLYPMVSSTAARTRMKLVVTRQDFVSLTDICRSTIVQHMQRAQLDEMLLPVTIRKYLEEAMDTPPVTNFPRCEYFIRNFE